MHCNSLSCFTVRISLGMLTFLSHLQLFYFIDTANAVSIVLMDDALRIAYHISLLLSIWKSIRIFLSTLTLLSQSMLVLPHNKFFPAYQFTIWSIDVSCRCRKRFIFIKSNSQWSHNILRNFFAFELILMHYLFTVLLYFLWV